MSSSSAENVNRLHLYCKFSYRSRTIDYCFVFPRFLIQFYALDVSLAKFSSCFALPNDECFAKIKIKNNGQYDANALYFRVAVFLRSHFLREKKN